MTAAYNYLRAGHYREALQVLGSISERNAQWFYFSAVANMGIGNNVTALEHAQTAVQMDTSNMEYQMLLKRKLVSEHGLRIWKKYDGKQLLHAAYYAELFYQFLLQALLTTEHKQEDLWVRS